MVPTPDGSSTQLGTVATSISVVNEDDAATDAGLTTGDLTYGITLKDNIAMNFNITVLDSDKANTTVEIITGDTTTTYTAAQGTQIGGTNVYQFTTELAPAQMTELVKVKVKVGDEIKSHKAYTVKQYAKEYMTANPGSAAETVLNEMLNYGAMAQIFFNYNEDDLANANVTAAVAQTAVPRKPSVTPYIEGVVVGLDYLGATLTFENRLALRYYFQPTADSGKAITDFDFTLRNSDFTAFQQNGTGYYMEVTNILPSNYGVPVQATAAAEGQTENILDIYYSPMAYMCRMYYNSGDANLQNMLKAMYNYFIAAEAYTGSSI